jgi:pantoate--beta-alanine ligase
MQVIRTIKEMQLFSKNKRKNGKTIGFVPTMGALHKGHINLVEKALEENETVVVSIFVNPVQFNNAADLEKYPRTWENDITLLKKAGCHCVFNPEVNEMYPEPVTHFYDFGMLDKVMEGKFRPGHFNGVAVVVKKLLDIIMPHKAYFGQKDFQQLAIIKAMVKTENLLVDIIPCPTIRENDGLAMSSRNMRLTPNQRTQASQIFNTLKKASEWYQEMSIDELIKKVQITINENPEMELEYFEISDTETLIPVRKKKKGKSLVACIAVYMGDVRLIDNMIFNC